MWGWIEIIKLISQNEMIGLKIDIYSFFIIHFYFFFCYVYNNKKAPIANNDPIIQPYMTCLKV